MASAPTNAEPFSAFMARALHDPKSGYYARNIQTVGARGDFSTSATLSPLLGKAIAQWLRQESSRVPQIRHVIEIGAGDGSLMHTVMHSLGRWQRFIKGWRFHIVDTSSSLRVKQRAKLGNNIVWHDSVTAALQATGGEAFIYHNELLDAFPVRLLQWNQTANAWQEVYVQFSANGSPTESLRPLDLPDQSPFSALQFWPRPLRDGQRIELHTSVCDWLQEWTPHWHCGSMLTIDYGDTFPAVYYRLPRGTLRSFLMQQRLEGLDIYAKPGRQDITADINFTDYRNWTQALGLEEVTYQTQAEFIRALVSKPDEGHPANSFLMNEDGAGGAFKCIHHRRLRR